MSTFLVDVIIEIEATDERSARLIADEIESNLNCPHRHHNGETVEVIATCTSKRDGKLVREVALLVKEKYQ